MSFEIFFLSLLLISSVSTSSRKCQCQCCQYMGRLYSNKQGICPCPLKNVTTPFLCGGSTGRSTAQFCGSQYHPIYDPNRPNLCCRLVFIL